MYFVRDAAHHCDAVSPLTSDGLGVGRLCTHTDPANAPKICSAGCMLQWLFALSTTFKLSTSSFTRLSTNFGKKVTLCEGVSMFRNSVDGRLFMLGSHLSGWHANGAMLFMSSQ